jgi:hypothetical protein
MRARYRADSFIKVTDLVDNRYLDVNQLPSFQLSITDETYVIESEYDQRPDLLAHSVYGNSRLWWVFGLRNPDVLVDPIRDFRTGTVITLPSQGTVKSMGDGITGAG